MSVLVLKYSFESNEIDGLTIYNSSYGARSLAATFSAQNMVSSNTYIVGGQSVALSGTNFITLPDLSNLTPTITISLWAYISSSRSQRLMELRNSTQRYFISYDSANNIVFTFNTTRYTFTNAAIASNNWHHIAWVISPNTWNIYVNNNKNVINQTTNFTGTITGASSFLGKGSADNPFIGFVDDFRIYTGALSDDQIYEIFDRGTYSNYYRFEAEDVASRGVANVASGLPVYDASIVAVSSPSTTYGTAAFNVVADVFKSGNASIYSNGTAGNYVSISTIPNINPSGITMSVWYYAQPNSGKQTVCSIGTANNHWVISYDGSSKQIALSQYTGASSPLTLRGEMLTFSVFPNGYLLGNNLFPSYLRYGGTIDDNRWHHITWAITPTYWKIQINGSNSVLYSSASMSTTGVSMSTVLSSMPAAFTANSLFSNPFLSSNLKGYIDDFRVYNRALNDDEMLKLFYYRCLRTNFYTGDGTDLINVFDYNTGVSTGVNTGYKNEANEPIHNIFAPFSPSIVSPQLSVNAHLFSETVLHISDNVSGDANPVRAIDRIKVGQIVASSSVSGKPYVLSVDRNANTVVLNKSGGSAAGNSGIGYAGSVSATNGVLNLLMDAAQQRSYSGNAPAVGDLVYHSLIPTGTYIKDVYEFANLPANVPTLVNGNFTIPVVSNNSAILVASPFSNITNWTITANNTNIYVANNSSFWGFPALPTGITTWLVVQSGGANSGATASYTFTLNSVGYYAIHFYATTRQMDNTIINNTIAASVNGATTGALYVGNTAWSLQTVNFAGVEGSNTVSFSVAFGGENVSAIYLTGVSVSNTALTANQNNRSYIQYSLLLSNASVNIPLFNGENVFWKKTTTTGFYTPTEFSGDTGYFLLSPDGRYEDYVYKLFSLGGSTMPFVATGSYSVVDHANGYYTITFSEFGTIKFVNDVASIQLLVVGSGGAGGRAVFVPSGGFGVVVGGGGGEGGQVMYYSSYGVIPNNVYIIDVGMGGISLLGNNLGSNGSPTRFGNEVAMGGSGGSAGTSTSSGVVGGAGGAGLTNGGDGGLGGNTLAQAGGDGVLITFGVYSPTYYGGGGAGGNGGNINYGSTPNYTVVSGGVGGGGNNGVGGANGTGGGGGGGNGYDGSVGSGGKGVVLIYVGAPPDAPRALTPTTRTNTTIGLTFKPPNRIALSYTVYATPLNGGGTTTTQTFAGTSYTITGLVPNTEYTIYVSAQNSVGSSTSPSITASTLTTLSPKPDIQVVSVDNNSVDIYANSPSVFADTYSAYLTLYYSPFTSTPTYTSRTNYLHIGNLVKNAWYIASVNGATTYGGMDTATQLFRTKHAADAVSGLSVGMRTGETIQFTFSRPSVDNGTMALFHYTFDTITVSGNDVGNIASGKVVYDASLSGSSISSIARYGTSSLTSARFLGFPFKINQTYNFSQYTAISVCLWVNANRLYRGAFDTQPLWLFSFNNSTTVNGGLIYAIRFQSFGGLTLYCANRIYQISISTPRNAWTHIALTQVLNTTSGGSGALNVYINGVLRFTNANVDTYSENMVASVNYLGSINDGNAFYDGFLDDYRLYNVELTAAQVASVFNNTISPIYPIDFYQVYYGDITGFSATANVVAYKVHPRLVKSGRIANLKYDALALSTIPVYDASLINAPSVLLSKNYHELALISAYRQCAQLRAFTVGTGGFTFACWFRSNSSPSGASVFYASTTNAAAVIQLYISGNDLMYSLDNAMTPRTLRSGGMNSNDIFHLVLVLSARSGTTCTATAYLNGSSIYNETGITYPQIAERTNVFLGRNATNDVYFNGGIFDTFIWNRPITFTEISSLYNNVGITFSQQTIADVPSATNITATLTGLVPRKVFATVVSTVNADGESNSDMLIMKTRNVPDAPSGFSVYDITDISASFQFTPPEQAVSYYLLSLKTYSTQTSSYTTVVDLSFGESPYAYGGLSKNTNYTAFLYAINNDGTSPFTAAIFTTLKEPDPPSNIVFTGIGNTFAQFTFSPASGYNVLAYDLSAITQDAGETSVYASFTYNAFLTSYTLNGLKGGVNYTLYLSARNIFGNSPSVSVSFQTTFMPNSPTNFVVSDTTDTTISVTYTPPLQVLIYYTLSVSPASPTLFRDIAFSPQTVVKTQPNDVVCMAISASATATRLAILGTNRGLRYVRIIAGTWGAISTPVVNFSVSPSMNAVTACAITPNASRIVVAYGMSTIYWGDGAGLFNGAGNTLYLVAVADTTPRLCYGVAIAADANRIVATEYNGYVYFAAWGGTNYGALTRTYETTLRKYGGVDITANGEKMVYVGDGAVYWAYWNGANYLSGTRVSGSANVNGTRALAVSFVYRDEDIVAVSSLNGRPQYCVWDYAAGNYGALTDISATALPITQGYGLASDASGAIYLSPFSDTNIYATTVSYQKYSPITDISLSPTANNGTVSGLLKNTTYNLSLVAYNIYGGSSPAITSGTTTNPPDGVTSVSAVPTNIAVDISYCSPRQPVASYYVEVESAGVYYYKNTASITTRFAGLSPNTQYITTVDAINASGNSPDASSSFTTTNLPSTPNTPTVWALSSSAVDLYFTLPEYDASLIAFAGNTQIVASSASAFALSTGTVECWFKTASTSSGVAGLVVKKGAFGLFVNAAKLGVYNYASNAWDIITAFNVNDNYWHHAALVFQTGVSGGSALYFDGRPVDAFTTAINNQSSAFAVGCVAGETANNFTGNICEVRVWSVAQTAASILMYYNKRLRQLFVGVSGYFPLIEGEGSVAKNAVKNSGVVNLPITSATNVWTNGVLDIVDLSNTTYSVAVLPAVSGVGTPIYANSPDRNISVSGLLVNTPYLVSLSSANSFGNAPTSSAPITITTRTTTSPRSPVNFAVVGYSDVSLSYSFTRPVDNPTVYKIYASPVYGTRATVSATLSPTSASSVNGVLSGLTSNVKYLVYATAFSAGMVESPPSNTVVTTTPFPSPTITVNSFTDVSASITVSPTSYFAEYYIATFVDNGGGEAVVATFSTATATATGLTTATLYSVSVIAVAKGVQSLPSNAIAFYTNGITTTPQNLSVSSFGDTSATIAFSPPQYGTVSSYRVVASTNTSYVSSIFTTNFTTPITNQRSDNIGFAISQPASVRLALFATLLNISFSRIVNGVWGMYMATILSGISPIVDFLGVALNYGGTRAVVIHGTQNSTGLIYWGNTTNLLNGTGVNLTLTQTLETNVNGYTDVALTADGNRLVALVRNGYVYFATWNGSNYTAFTQTVNTTPIRDYRCICVSSDGERIAYCENVSVYWAVWDASSSHYVNEKYAFGSQSIQSRSISFLGDNKDVLIYAGGNSPARYYTWNGVNYNLNPNPISTLSIPATDNWGFTVDASNVIYTAPYSNTNVYISNATVSYFPLHQVVQTFSAPASSYTITGLASYRSYDISLAAVNSFGTSTVATTTVVCGGTTGALVANTAYTLYRFTQSGTITISGARTVYYVIVGGGGNGPNCSVAFWNSDAPGAGAGGVVSGVINQSSSTTYSIHIGRGGVAAGFTRQQNVGNPSRVYFENGNTELVANGGQSSESGYDGGAAGTTVKGLTGVANVTESGAATAGSNKSVGFAASSYTIVIDGTTYRFGGGGAGGNSGTAGQTSSFGGGGGGTTGVSPVSGASNTGGGGGGHVAFTSSTSVRNQTASGGSGVVLFFY